jgi:hypothetical protein
MVAQRCIKLCHEDDIMKIHDDWNEAKDRQRLSKEKQAHSLYLYVGTCRKDDEKFY